MSINDPLPKYLLEKTHLVATVTFTALFSLVFLLVEIPFTHNAWFELGYGRAFGLTVAFFSVALFIVIVSKVLMYRNRNVINLTLKEYMIWNFLEVLAISLLYTMLTIGGEQLGFLRLGGQEPLKIFLGAVLYVTISLGVPYIIAGQYYAINEKNNTIRLMNFGNVVSDTEPLPSERQKITLFDNNGMLKLSVNSSSLYYIESDDNYIIVWYTDSNDDLKQYMLRCKLKTVEESFADSDLVRCHRKYIVNMSKVKVLSKEKEGYVIDLGTKGIEPIPVSKTYEEAIISRFNSR